MKKTGRKGSERPLDRQAASSPETWWRAAAEGSPDAIVVTDPTRRIVLANAAACRLTGYGEDELLGRPSSDLGEAFPASHDSPPSRETRLIRKDHTTLDVESTRWPIRWAGEVRTLTVLRDATARRQAEEALRQREEAFRQMVERADEGIAIVQHSVIQYANPRLVEMWGGPSEEVLQAPFTRFVHPDELPRVLDHLERRMAGESVPTTYETVLVRRDGKGFPAELSAGVLPYRGEPADFVFVRDVTARRRGEEALRESERRYAALFDHSNDGIFIFDLDLVHIAANRRGAEMIGYTPEELVGKAIADTADPRELPDIWRKRVALLAGERVGVYPRLFRTKDGSPLPVEVNLSLVRDCAGRPIRIQSVVRDVRERRQAQEALERSAERLRTLATRLAEVEVAERQRLARELHDQVGQNLAALAINLNLIASQAPPSVSPELRSRLRDSLLLLEETTRRIRDVMADLRPPVLEDYGLMAALRRHAEQFEQRTGVPVSVEGADPSPRLSPHLENALFRIAQEALTNVGKHAQATQVRVTLGQGEGAVRLEVRDDGVGFSAEVGPARDGRSLGMISMAERAESVGGSCRVSSAPGEGTQVLVEVPR